MECQTRADFAFHMSVTSREAGGRSEHVNMNADRLRGSQLSRLEYDWHCGDSGAVKLNLACWEECRTHEISVKKE